MWRFIALAALGMVIGTRARSERRVVVAALSFGLLYGGAQILTATMAGSWPSPGRAAFLLLLGIVMAAPVYAVAELWRRAQRRLGGWWQRYRRREPGTRQD